MRLTDVVPSLMHESAATRPVAVRGLVGIPLNGEPRCCLQKPARGLSHPPDLTAVPEAAKV